MPHPPSAPRTASRPRDPWPAPQGKREATRRRVLLAAEQVFAKSSVERAKIEDIAARAGVAVGTIYAHFESKEGLAVAYLDGIFDLLDADLAALRKEPSPIERVMAAGDAYLQHVIDYPIASRMASVRAAYPPSEHQEAFAQQLDRRMVGTLMAVATDLKASMDADEIPAAPVEEAMVFIWGAWHGMATMVARCDHLTIPPDLALRAGAWGRRMISAGLGVERTASRGA